MKLGHCVTCNAQIIKFNKNNMPKVLGSYRSVLMHTEEDGSFEVPLCIDCHDSFSSENFDDLAKKFYHYMREVAPKTSENYKNVKFSGFVKKGSLKAQDIQGGAKIWR